MKAICIHRYGGPLSLQLDDCPIREPGLGEVRIKVEAAGINNSDLQTTYGKYRGLGQGDLPYVLGQEAAGVILAVGPNVTEFAVGMRVFGHVMGAFAEEAIAPASELLALPSQISAQLGASLPIAYLTAGLALVHKAQVQPGEWVLVHPGSGGVGSATIQLAKVLGAKVIATTRSPDKISYLQQIGADDVLLYSQDLMTEAIQRITLGSGVQVAIDGGGQVTLPQCLDSMANGGRIVSYGYTTGLTATVPIVKLIGRNVSIFGIALWYNADYCASWQTLQNIVLSAVMQGKIIPSIQRVSGFLEFREALIQLEQHRLNDKLVLIPSFD